MDKTHPQKAPPGKALSSVVILAAFAAFFMPGKAEARDQIRIVGSSTVYPFATAAAEEFGKSTQKKTPLIESTGTGGGFKLFCSGAGDDTPDISNASRAIKPTETELCAKNGVKDITEIKIGFDGIVIANAKNAPHYNLTKAQIFQALAKQLPDASGKLAANPHQKWSDIDPKLPAVKIEVYGPPPTSGTRDAFTEMVLEKSCTDQPAFKAAWPDDDARKKSCQLIREDGAYIEAGENDNLIVQKLENDAGALGIFGYSFLEQNAGKIQGSSVDGVVPAFKTIADGTYGISRPLFVYIKNQHLGSVDGISAFVQELVSDKAAGAEGYLAEKGLIPLPAEELAQQQKRAATLAKTAETK
jgi:phosphate transport system substrate-binding protein